MPVSITYDQLHEVGGDGGRAGRRREEGRGPGWLAGYAARAAAAASARRTCASASRSRCAEALGPTPGDDGRRGSLQKIAFEVCVGINRVTPVTATALVTLALLGVRDRALTLEPGARRARAAAATYLDARGLP